MSCREIGGRWAMCIMLGIGFIPSAYAQQIEPEPAIEDRGALADVLVTAQRREESAQNVGASIAALNAGQLDALNAGSAKDLVNHVSGVMVNDNFGTYSSYVIRGIGQNDFEANTAPSAAVYIDDVYKANTI